VGGVSKLIPAAAMEMNGDGRDFILEKKHCNSRCSYGAVERGKHKLIFSKSCQHSIAGRFESGSKAKEGCYKM
jgi:hypothetical protein